MLSISTQQLRFLPLFRQEGLSNLLRYCSLSQPVTKEGQIASERLQELQQNRAKLFAEFQKKNSVTTLLKGPLLGFAGSIVLVAGGVIVLPVTPYPALIGNSLMGFSTLWAGKKIADGIKEDTKIFRKIGEIDHEIKEIEK